MNTHLEFMLPDGAWDNSWGTRSFKWTYWGGRTSDGFMGGYYLMAARHPNIWRPFTAISVCWMRRLMAVFFMEECIISHPVFLPVFIIHLDTPKH